MMQATGETTQDLVLVGGGHAHALVLRMLAMQPVAGVRITLISPDSHTPYSGMLPGLVAGHYAFEDVHIDLARLCQWAGVRFLQAKVIGVDPVDRVLSLEGRPQIAFDLLSLDTGSEPELDSVPGAREWAVPVKPVAGLWQRWRRLAGKLQASKTETPHRIAVVGGGAGSVELILAMANYFRGQAVGFELFCGAGEILQGYNLRARKSVERALASQEISLHLDSRVVAVEQAMLCLDDDSQHRFDDLFWCTGAAAAPWIAASGMQCVAGGFLAVRDTLQVKGFDTIFAAGDVATQLNHPRPKAGVYAVRQAPVLAHNLRSALLNKPLRNYRPQQHFLSLVSLGGKSATADKGLFTATGGWVWRWKDHIDRKFMNLFEDLPTAMPTSKTDNASDSPDPGAQPPCGGCGAKVGADALAGVLAELANEFPGYAPGADASDDVAVIPGSEDREIVQSIDVLREIVADPWLMGRIAANHALSDLYASGAMPLSALATITLPFASPDILARELKQFLAGALQEFSAVNCRLQGGHSLQGQELNIGFVVNGIPMQKSRGLLPKKGLLPGDHLLLTKPLGTGTLFASHMQLKADGRDIQRAVAMMLQSNADAGKLAVEHGASAATDVTGFGLLRHLLEMLDADRGAKISTPEIPLLAGAKKSIAEGALSTMHAANVTAKEAIARLDSGVDPQVLELMVDPQTSGGLLIAIAPDRSAGLCEALRAAGYEDTAIIGELTAEEANAEGTLRIE